MEANKVLGFGFLLTQSNYKVWKTCMESYLLGEDLWEHVGGDSTVCPVATEDDDESVKAVKTWKVRNAKGEFALKRSISHELFEHIMGCKSASEIWTTLDRLFNKRNEARLQLLENELATLTQGDLSIAKFFLKVKTLCSEISAIDSDEPISEARMKRHITRGLKAEYMPFVTSVQGWATQPSLVEFENLLASQESLAMQMAGCSLSGGETNALSFEKKKFGKKSYSSKGESSSQHSKNDGKKSFRKFEGKCHRCGKVGHMKKDCRVKLEDGNVAECSNGNGHEKQGEEDWGGCFSANITTTDALASVNYENDWIIDSGCGHHLTGNISKFSSFAPYQGKEAIVTADNTVHPVVKEGVVNVMADDKSQITLGSVFQVPGVKKNLFSVANAVDDGHYVLFGPKDVKFLRNVSSIKGDVVHTGKRVKDLFVLSASSSYVEKMSTNDSPSLWHARLGHLGMDKLRVMASKKLVNGLPNFAPFDVDGVCEGCQLGKAHRLPFHRSSTRRKAPLELIHSDVMGPCNTPSYSGCRYMLLFVDDFTRFTWVYFLKEKSEALSKFKEFKANVEGVLERRIKCLRTDNGGEFTSNNFNTFCREGGIKRELSCAHTSQQNGVAERKIRHLVETCKSWLHAKNLPKALWAEGMACAAYVINRVPLSPIEFKSPFELMWNEKPLCACSGCYSD